MITFLFSNHSLLLSIVNILFNIDIYLFLFRILSSDRKLDHTERKFSRIFDLLHRIKFIEMKNIESNR